MRIIQCFFAMMLLAGNAFAATATFSWLPNSESDLAGYKIYCGTETGNYNEVKDCGLPDTIDGRVHCTVDNAPDGKFLCVATAYDTETNESDYSRVVSSNLPPDVVQELRVDISITIKTRTDGVSDGN